MTQAEVTLSDLRPHVNYSLRVAAVTGVGAGIFSQPVFCVTLQDGKPLFKCLFIYTKTPTANDL